MKKSIIWLASYPKSGNTWMRVFLTNYLVNADKPVALSDVHRFGLGDSIPKMYRMVAGGDVDIHNIPLTMSLRDRVLRGVVNNNADVNFIKTHNQRSEFMGVPLVPDTYTRSAIYIMRNPLDCVLSYAKHFNISLEMATEALCRSDTVTAPEESSIAQFLGSWSDHVRSWTGFAGYPITVIKYENLLAEPEAEFSKALKMIGVPIEDERLKKAIRFSSFKELSKQEDKQGFKEKPANSEKFFRSGKSGNWKTELPEELRDKLITTHKELMTRYGYL